MKLIRTILNQQPRVAPILTVIILVWVTGGLAGQCASSFRDTLNDTAASQERQVPADTQEEQAPFATVSSFNEAVIPITKIQILFIYHFLREWNVVEEINVGPAKDIPLPPDRFFLTLFRQIISPNAP